MLSVRQQGIIKVLGTMPPTRETQMKCQVSASTWPSPGCCRHVDSKPTNERPLSFFHCPTVCVCVCDPIIQVDENIKLFKKKKELKTGLAIKPLIVLT